MPMKQGAGRRSDRFSGEAILRASHRRGATPLLDPAACSVVLLVPSHQPKRAYDSYQRKTATLTSAAQIATVPTFLCCQAVEPEAVGDPDRTFTYEAHGCIWKNEAFLRALDAEDRSVLVLAGYWFDLDVTAAALYALADCYDVYIPLDASPGRSREATRLAETRLFQGGAKAVLKEQNIREWAIEISDAKRQAELAALMDDKR
jgi:hypothetical protein